MEAKMEKENGVARRRRKKKEMVYLFGVMREMRDEFLRRKKTASAHNYRSTIHAFKAYLGGVDIPITALNCELILGFERYLQQKGLVPNTTSFYMRVLRAVVNRAVLNRVLNPCEKLFVGVYTGTDKTKKRAISREMLCVFIALMLCDNPELQFARDMFLMSCCLCGMSFIDLAHLKKSDIRHNILTYVRRKTGKRLEIELLPETRAIIKRYAPQVVDSVYLFPILKDGSDSPRYESALRLQNKRLAQLSALLNLPVTLTTYVARHTWASIASAIGIPIDLISDLMGHAKVDTTRIYIGSLDKERLNKANKIVMSALMKRSSTHYAKVI